MNFRVSDRCIARLALAVLLVVAGCSSTDLVPPEDLETSPPVVSTPWREVVVTGSVVNLRAGPGTGYQVLGRAAEGDTLRVTGGLEDWYRIYQESSSLFAWIYAPLTSGDGLP